MTPLIVVAIGLVGGVGAVARFALDGLVAARSGSAFPFGTLVVNLLGALALGFARGRGGPRERVSARGHRPDRRVHDVQHVGV